MLYVWAMKGTCRPPRNDIAHPKPTEEDAQAILTQDLSGTEVEFLTGRESLLVTQAVPQSFRACANI